MIGQTGGHGGGAGLRAAVGVFLSEGSNWPTEVVAVEGEGADGFVDVPVFAEAVGLANFVRRWRIAVAVGAVVAFDEGPPRAD